MDISKEARKFTTDFLNQIGFKEEISLPLIDNISIKNIKIIGTPGCLFLFPFPATSQSPSKNSFATRLG